MNIDPSTLTIPAYITSMMALISVMMSLYSWHKNNWTPFSIYFVSNVFPRLVVALIFAYGISFPTPDANSDSFEWLCRFGYFILFLPDCIRAIAIVFEFARKKMAR